MSQGPLCPNLTKKFQKEVSQIANRNLSCVILLGGLSVNLNHLNRVHHEEYCGENPNRPPRVQCPYCVKDFARAKDLFKHSRKHHPGRDVQADMVQ